MFLSSERVVSVCFSSDGKQIASGSWDETVKIWNASSGELQSTLRGHTGNPESSVSCLSAIQAHFIREEFPPFFGEDECWVGLEDDLISKDHLQELLSDPDMNLTEADIEVLHVDALFDYLLSLDASQGELVKKDVFNKALEQADTSTVVYNPNPRLLCTLDVDGSISSLDFSPCGTKIAAACNDHDNDNYTVKILGSSSESAGTFECESTLTGHRYVPSPCIECLLL